MSKLWLIEVKREFADDDFVFHMRQDNKPTDEEILIWVARERQWIPSANEGYKFDVSEVTI